MVVTRSSALSLQAKTGVPRGNQIVGWIVLSKRFLFCEHAFTNRLSNPIRVAIFASPTAEQSLFASIDGHLLDFRAHLHPSHHFIRRTILSRIFCHAHHLGATRAQHLCFL